MNETNPTDPADTAAKPKAPTESATAPGALDAAKQKLASLAEKAKEHDFKGDAHKAAEGVKNLAENLKQRDFKEDARKAAEGVKNLKESLKTHDFKAELRDAFAETKKNPASIWKKPETLRPGKDLAVIGLAASVVLLLLLLVTSSSFLGLVCLVLGLGALLFSALGLKTEGRKLAVGGSVVGLLVLLCALGQTFGSSEGGDATDGEQAVASTDEDGTKSQTDKETASKTDTAPQKKKAAPMVGSKPKDYPVLVANEGKKTGKAEKIIKKADENASKLNSLNFFGFHTGMSLADFKTLREHYGLTNDQLWGYYNVENGDVHKICFTAKALDKIAHWPNNFDTVELHMLQYFGIVEWNNIKEVIEGEVDSIFQSDEDRLLFGDKANVPRQYRTADGVVATLFPTGWNIETREVFGLLDTKRQKSAAPIFRRFEQKNRMRNRLQELADQGIKVKMLQLPTGYEWLLREFDDGVWISAFPMTREEYTWLFCDVEYDKLSQKFKYDDADAIRKAIGENNGFADKFNELPPESKGTIARFREPFPEEMKKAFGSGIVDEKKYRELKQLPLRPLIKPSIPAIIVADEATSGQLNRTPMFIVHEPDRISEREWKRYTEERSDLIRAGKTDAQLSAAGYGLDAREWHEKRKDKALSAYVESEGGSIDGKLLFLPNYSKEEREIIEAKRRAKREAEWAEQRAREEAQQKAAAEAAAKAAAEKAAAEKKAQWEKEQISMAYKELKSVQEAVEPFNSFATRNLEVLNSLPTMIRQSENFYSMNTKPIDEKIVSILASISAKKKQLEELRVAGELDNKQKGEERSLIVEINSLEGNLKTLLRQRADNATLNNQFASINTWLNEVKKDTNKAKAIVQQLESEGREKSNRKRAEQLRGSGPDKAIKDYLAAADVLKSTREQLMDYLGKVPAAVKMAEEHVSKIKDPPSAPPPVAPPTAKTPPDNAGMAVKSASSATEKATAQ